MSRVGVNYLSFSLRAWMKRTTFRGRRGVKPVMNFPTSKMVHLRDATLEVFEAGSEAALLCYAMAGRSMRLAIDTRFLRWSMLDTTLHCS